MHFARTEEQDELAGIIASLLSKRSDSEAVRAAMASELGYDASLWQAMCEQVGVAALCIPEEYDGFGASLIETAIALEELGANLAPSPLLASAYAAVALLLHGTDEAKQELLPRIAAGETATLGFDELVLDGTADIVLRIHNCVFSWVEDADVEPVGTLDQTIRFAKVTGGTSKEIGHVEDARPLRAVGAALATALQVGAAQRGLDMTVAYAKEREQFGRPIGSFQALKHRMADMLVLVEASRSISWGATAVAASYVADPSDAHRANLLRLSAAAQSYCSDALDQIASETVQLHGGIAITWEHDAHLVFKRAHALSQLFGPAHAHRGSLID